MEQMLAQTLGERYLNVVELAKREALLAVELEKLALDQQELALEQERAGSMSYTLANMQKVLLTAELKENEIRNHRIAIERMRTGTNIAAPALSAKRNRVADVQLSQYLVSPREVESLIDNRFMQASLSSIDQRVAQTQFDAAKHKRSLEKARNRFGLDLLEFSYENKGIDSYNVTMGFRLPTHSYGSHRSQQEFLTSQRTADLTNLLAQERQQKITQQLFVELDTYFAHAVSLSDLALRESPGDADSALLVKRHRLELNQRAIEQHAKVLRALTHGLLELGLIYERPLKNWLLSP